MSVEADTREYLLREAAPLLQDFLAELVQGKPQNVTAALLEFATRRNAAEVESQALDTERFIAQSAIQCTIKTEECIQCTKSHQQFLAIAYDVLQSSTAPPWQLPTVVKKLRKRTVTRCKLATHRISGLSTTSVPKLSDLRYAEVKTRGTPSKPLTTSSSSTSDEDIDEAEDLPDVFQHLPLKWHSGIRKSVCGDTTLDLLNFELPNYQKSEEEMKRLLAHIRDCIIFHSINEPEQQRRLALSMKSLTIAAGATLIRKGDTGDGMYVLESGVMEVVDISGRLVRTVNPGDFVGELAVLYRCPRSKTVIAKTDCSLWFLDRQSFEVLAREEASKNRNQFEQFLRAFPLLQSMGMYARGRVADALTKEKFNSGDTLMQEGEVQADKVYFVMEGAVQIMKGGAEIRQCGAHTLLGERAIMRHTTRSATVIAKTELVVASMSRKAFKRVMLDVYPEIEEYARRNYVDD